MREWSGSRKRRRARAASHRKEKHGRELTVRASPCASNRSYGRRTPEPPGLRLGRHRLRPPEGGYVTVRASLRLRGRAGHRQGGSMSRSRAGAALMLLLLPALAAAAQPAGSLIKGSPSKPAWKWSVDERLAKRFDPESMKARAEARTAKLNDFEKRFPAPADDLFTGALKNQQNVDTIEGETNPELFLTFELFNQLLVMGFPPDGMNQQESRRLIEERAAVLGFGQDLWGRLERAAAPFLKLQRREEQLARKGVLPSRPADGTKMSP